MAKACKGAEYRFFHQKAIVINNICVMGLGGGGIEIKKPEMVISSKA
jgi:hypothetical protein